MYHLDAKIGGARTGVCARVRGAGTATRVLGLRLFPTAHKKKKRTNDEVTTKQRCCRT